MDSEGGIEGDAVGMEVGTEIDGKKVGTVAGFLVGLDMVGGIVELADGIDFLLQARPSRWP